MNKFLLTALRVFSAIRQYFSKEEMGENKSKNQNMFH